MPFPLEEVSCPTNQLAGTFGLCFSLEDNNVILALNTSRKQGFVHNWQSRIAMSFRGLVWGCLSIYLYFPLCCLKLPDGPQYLGAASNKTPLVLLSLRGLITYPLHGLHPFLLFLTTNCKPLFPAVSADRLGLDACTFQHHFLP